jgi:hypothetical protein
LIDDVTVNEAAGTMTFTISLNRAIDIPVTIDVNYTDVTATGGNVDYDSAPDATTFPANSTASRTVTVAIADDNLVELTETFTAALSTATALGSRNVTASDTGTGTITDNDAAVFLIDDVSVSEAAGTMTFTISLNNPIDIPVTIDVTYTDVSATGGNVDYDGTADATTFPANSTASRTVTVAITNDNVVELNETFMAALSTATPLGTRNVTANDAGTGTILNDDSATVSIAGGAVLEGNSGTANLPFTITLSNPVDIAVTVQFSTADGTAAAPVDYAAQTGVVVTIPANSTTVTHNVVVNGDTNVEPDESVLGSLAVLNASGRNVSFGTASDSGWILTDDVPGIFGQKSTPWASKDGGWTIQLYHDADNDGNFEPNGPFGLPNGGTPPADDGEPVRIAVTDASGKYIFPETEAGKPDLIDGDRYFVREVVPQGWRQVSPTSPPYYTVTYDAGTQVNAGNFQNDTCYPAAAGDLFEVGNGTVTPPIEAQWKGILTIELIPSDRTIPFPAGSLSVVKSGGGSFSYFDGTAKVTGAAATGRPSEFDKPGKDYRLRVDLLVNKGDKFDVTVSNSDGHATLRVLNAVNVDVGGTLALQIQGSNCGETIIVVDDPNSTQPSDNASDAKRIMIGAVTSTVKDKASLDFVQDGAALTFDGIQYNATIVNSMFGNPTVSRVEVNAYGGDDIIRIGDGSVMTIGAQPVVLGAITQQTVISGGDGDDAIRAGVGKMTAYGNNGDDFIVGGPADDILNGNAGRDLIYGYGGSDRADGGDGDDIIGGGDGDDALLRGGYGNDRISGGAGKDRLVGDADTDTYYTDGVDLLISGFEINGGADTVESLFTGAGGLIERFWNDGNSGDGLDTLDELIASLLP